MGRKYVLVDDLDGKELPDDTQPIKLTLGRTSYRLYLSDANHAKLLEAVTPFIEDAERDEAPRTSGRSASRPKSDTAAIRYWAKENGHKVGEKGRINKSIVDAWRDAGSPAIGS